MTSIVALIICGTALVVGLTSLVSAVLMCRLLGEVVIKQGENLMTQLNDAVQQIVSAINDATNKISADISAVASKVSDLTAKLNNATAEGNGLTLEETTNLQAQLSAEKDKLDAAAAALEAIGSDPANPVPGVPTPTTDGGSAPQA
jgi:uncharacterized phage infection (PIP) family protein YhgE